MTRLMPNPRINAKMSQERNEQIEKAFDFHDRDKDKQLEFDEFQCALRCLGFEANKDEATILLTNNNYDPRHNVTYPQFLNIVTQLFTQKCPEIEIRTIFRLFDDDQGGMIDLNKLRRACQHVGVADIEDDRLKDMIDVFDTNGNQLVYENDFLEFMMKSYDYK